MVNRIFRGTVETSTDSDRSLPMRPVKLLQSYDGGTMADTPKFPASLLSSQATGGLHGSRGYRVQDAYAIVHAPDWLLEPRFAAVMVEAAGDVDCLFTSEAETWRTYTQVKDFHITPTKFRPIINEFRKRQQSSGETYKRYRLVARGFVNKFDTVVEGVSRLRQAEPFYKDGGKMVLQATRADLDERAKGCGLSPEDVTFILDYVDFEDLSGLHDPDTVKLRFKGGLGRVFDATTEQGRDNAYKAIYELIRNGIGRIIMRGQLETAIKVALDQAPYKVSGGRSAVAGLASGARVPDMLAPLAQIHDELNDHPDWAVGIQLMPTGERFVSLHPRSPNAIEKSPLKLEVKAELPKSVKNMKELLRYIYATGNPFSFQTKQVTARLGELAVFDQPGGVMEISLPPDLHESTSKCQVTSALGVTFDYYVNLSWRTFDGVTYADNRHQPSCPIQVRLEVKPNADGRTAMVEFNFALSDAGHRRARHQLKFLRFLHAVAVENRPITFTNVETDQKAPFLGGMVSLPGLDFAALEEALAAWTRIVEFEDTLGVIFELPEEISPDDYDLAQRLWGLFVKGEAEFDMPPVLVKVKSGEAPPEELHEMLSRENPFVMTGTTSSDSVELWGTTVIMPERKITMKPLFVKNRRALQRAVRSSRSNVLLVLESEGPITMKEELSHN